jgi:phosphatidate cytidylyltransferase
MKNLLKRFLSSIILIVLFYITLIVNNYLFFLIILLVLIISLYEWNKIVIKSTISSIFLLRYIGYIFLFFSIYSVLEVKNINDNNDHFIYVILICIGSDLGGYIFGNIFGGPKLTKISPKKTYTGFFGGIFFSILFYIVFNLNYNLKILSYDNFNLNLLLLTLLLSSLSQLGDLVMSYFKRKSAIKDISALIPGHGGLLDRIDGMIFVFPFFYLIEKLAGIQ